MSNNSCFGGDGGDGVLGESGDLVESGNGVGVGDSRHSDGTVTVAAVGLVVVTDWVVAVMEGLAVVGGMGMLGAAGEQLGAGDGLGRSSSSTSSPVSPRLTPTSLNPDGSLICALVSEN